MRSGQRNVMGIARQPLRFAAMFGQEFCRMNIAVQANGSVACLDACAYTTHQRALATANIDDMPLLLMSLATISVGFTAIFFKSSRSLPTLMNSIHDRTIADPSFLTIDIEVKSCSIAIFSGVTRL